MDSIKQKLKNEITHSIVQATIDKYRNLGDRSDIAVRTYAERNLVKRDEEVDARKIMENKKEEEQMKKELNEAAELVIQRINDKLRGTEFPERHQRPQQRGGHPMSADGQEHEFSMNQIEQKDDQFSNNQKDIKEQVDLLIYQATSHENLAQCYPGWCPYW
jgi:hypothetical protein